VRHIRTPVSLIVRHDRGKVVVRWGEGGVLRSRSFGGAVDPDAWYDAIHFYLSKVIIRDTLMLLEKRREHLGGSDTFKLRVEDIEFFLVGDIQ